MVYRCNGGGRTLGWLDKGMLNESLISALVGAVKLCCVRGASLLSFV